MRTRLSGEELEDLQHFRIAILNLVAQEEPVLSEDF